MQERILQTLSFHPPKGSPVTVQVVRQGFHVGPEIVDINGHRPYPSFKSVNTLAMSPDGSRLAIFAESMEGSRHVYIDGKENLALEDLSSRISFSKDSRHYSYVARIKNDAGEQRYVVIADSRIVHDEPYIFGYDSHFESPGSLYGYNLEPVIKPG